MSGAPWILCSVHDSVLDIRRSLQSVEVKVNGEVRGVMVKVNSLVVDVIDLKYLVHNFYMKFSFITESHLSLNIYCTSSATPRETDKTEWMGGGRHGTT